ncbi:DUF3455 domain-containing protein [Ramlibacter sp. PS4R-6]|uniref:DUF3455 domain-containing protein n=1 Tax=Ramlibacter sp. PS4R-6 TaxID=3133438 RepID=UPI0030A09543
MKSFVIAASTALALGACAESRQVLQPSSAERVSLTLNAAGVQVYQCRQSRDNPVQHEWGFVGPEADLYDSAGQRAGRHYGGPTWEALDGSKVMAQVAGRAPAKSPDSIPWLLLKARPAAPQGTFGNVTSIQRLETVGGSAPAQACSTQNAGETVRVPYAAQYVFFTR